uniref:Uncharacterized protein n=1 Tax=Bradyrhizobium japonicum TaxID=375 RepID=Q9L8L5_BRAJP|nr:unknown [Bradyrhizobium japonicum]
MAAPRKRRCRPPPRSPSCWIATICRSPTSTCGRRRANGGSLRPIARSEFLWTIASARLLISAIVGSGARRMRPARAAMCSLVSARMSRSRIIWRN